MSFKVHDRLNRIVEVSVNLQNTGKEVRRLIDLVATHEKELNLMMIHYLQGEMEYGKLIGEPIDNTEFIDTLLRKHHLIAARIAFNFQTHDELEDLVS